VPNTDNGNVVTALTTIEPDMTAWSPVAETFTYALLDIARGRFTLDDDEIVVADGARTEGGESYELLVRSTDKGGLSVDQLLIVSATAPPASFSAIAALDEASAFGGNGINEADAVLQPFRVMCGRGSSDPIDNDPAVGDVSTDEDASASIDFLMV